MAEPISGTTLVVAGLALAASATAATAAIAQARAQNAASQYNAQVSDINANVARDNAKYEADRLRERASRVIGAQRARFSAAGLDLLGTPVDVEMDSLMQNAWDIESVKHAGEVKAADFNADATLSRFEGRNAITQSYFTAASTMLSGASSAAGAGGGGGVTAGSANYTRPQTQFRANVNPRFGDY